jgi:hypothetical protein
VTGLPKILYDNRFKDAAPVASSTAVGNFNVLNMTDFRPYTWWKPTALPATVRLTMPNNAGNPGFEDATIAPWNVVGDKETGTIDAAIFFEGIQSGKIEVTAAGGVEQLHNYAFRAFPLWKNNGRVTLTARIRGTVGREIGLRAVRGVDNPPENLYNDANQDVASYAIADGSWQVFNVTLPAWDNSSGRNTTEFDIRAGLNNQSVPVQIGDVCNVDAVYFHAGAADYALIHGHNLGSLGDTVEIRGSRDNFSTDVLVASSTPSFNDKPILLQFVNVFYPYWEIKLIGPALPSLAIAPIGQALQFPRRLARGFDPLGRKPESQTNISIKGHPLGTVIDFEEWSEKISFKNIDWSWVRDNWIPAWEAHLRGNPFMFAWDPVDHANEIYLVSRRGGYSAPHDVAKCDLSFEIAGRAT